MTFVLHDDGRAKVINKSQWGNYVRLISTKVTTSSRSRTNSERGEKAMINGLPPAIQHKQDKACDMRKDPPFVRSSVPLHEKYDAEYVQHWERITLSHFRTTFLPAFESGCLAQKYLSGNESIAKFTLRTYSNKL